MWRLPPMFIAISMLDSPGVFSGYHQKGVSSERIRDFPERNNDT